MQPSRMRCFGSSKVDGKTTVHRVVTTSNSWTSTTTAITSGGCGGQAPSRAPIPGVTSELVVITEEPSMVEFYRGC